jgi:hypothetical protein
MIDIMKKITLIIAIIALNSCLDIRIRDHCNKAIPSKNYKKYAECMLANQPKSAIGIGTYGVDYFECQTRYIGSYENVGAIQYLADRELTPVDKKVFMNSCMKYSHGWNNPNDYIDGKEDISPSDKVF